MTEMKTATGELLCSIYKNVKMASDALLTLMPKVKNENLKNDMTVQVSVYEGFASRAAKLLAENGTKPEEEGMMTKMGAKMGMMMNTLRDASTSHLAEMLVEGSEMGVNDMTTAIRRAEQAGVAGEPLHLARHLCDYERERAEKLRTYLK